MQHGSWNGGAFGLSVRERKGAAVSSVAGAIELEARSVIHAVRILIMWLRTSHTDDAASVRLSAQFFLSAQEENPGPNWHSQDQDAEGREQRRDTNCVLEKRNKSANFPPMISAGGLFAVRSSASRRAVTKAISCRSFGPGRACRATGLMSAIRASGSMCPEDGSHFHELLNGSATFTVLAGPTLTACLQWTESGGNRQWVPG